MYLYTRSCGPRVDTKESLLSSYLIMNLRLDVK